MRLRARVREENRLRHPLRPMHFVLGVFKASFEAS